MLTKTKLYRNVTDLQKANKALQETNTKLNESIKALNEQALKHHANSFSSLIGQSFRGARDKGFWLADYRLLEEVSEKEDFEYKERIDTIISKKLMLIVSELGEAMEALRKTTSKTWLVDSKNQSIAYQTWKENYSMDKGIDFYKWYFEQQFKDSFADEIADVFIRLFDLIGFLQTFVGMFSDHHDTLVNMIQAKLAYNKCRPQRHGKEF